jgi:hypothetical protein
MPDIYENYLDKEIEDIENSSAVIVPTRGTYDLTAAPADGASTKLSWAENPFTAQDNVLDLTDPLNPAGVVAGLYMVTISVQSIVDPVVKWRLKLVLDDNNDAPEAIVFAPPLGTFSYASLSLSFPMPAAGVIVSTVLQNSGGVGSFSGQAQVVVVPT